MEDATIGTAAEKDAKPKITRRRKVQVCDRCRTRRIRCDRLQPACSACLKSGHACQYLEASDKESVIVPRSRRQDTKSASVRGLEELVNRLERQLENSRGETSETQENDTPAESQLHGLVVPGQDFKYFSPLSWAAVSENIADIRHLLNQHHLEADDAETEDEAPQPTPSLSVFPPASPDSDPEDVPFFSDNQSTALLHVYFDRVDCMIKIIHRSTFCERYKYYRQTRPQPYSVRNETPIDLFGAGPTEGFSGTTAESSQKRSIPNYRAFEALLLAVYYAAVIAGYRDDSMQSHLANDVPFSDDSIAMRYQRAAESALQRANFIQSESLETLQALVLMISVRPRGPDPRTPWIQLGLAVRIAQAMGLHRDGSHYNLDPVETEVRRRVWAQIRLLDLRAAEELGCEPTILEGTYDTNLPSNVSDYSLCRRSSASLNPKHFSGVDEPRVFENIILPSWSTHDSEICSLPAMEAPDTTPNFSDMTFPLIRFEAVRLLGKLLSPRYEPKDLLYGHSHSVQQDHNQPSRSRAKAALDDREDKTMWVNQLENRYHDVYGIHELDLKDPKRRITAKVAMILLAKARFIANLQDWKENGLSSSKEENEAARNSLFLTAVAIVEETSILIQDQVLSNWSWYIRSFTEVYACTFVLSTLVRGGVSPDISERCWEAIDCLFPASSSNDSQTKPRLPLQKLVAYARARRINESVNTQGNATSFDHIGENAAMRDGGDPGSQYSQDGEDGGLSWIDQFVDEMVASRLPPWNDLTEFLFQ